MVNSIVKVKHGVEHINKHQVSVRRTAGSQVAAGHLKLGQKSTLPGNFPAALTKILIWTVEKCRVRGGHSHIVSTYPAPNAADKVRKKLPRDAHVTQSKHFVQ